MRAARFVIALVVTIVLLGLLFQGARHLRVDHTDEICRIRLLRMGEAVALYVEDKGGAAFPDLRNPPAQTPWVPGLPQSAGDLLRPYLGGDLRATPQRADENREDWLRRARASEMSCCPATGFAYLANLELLAQSPGSFTRTDAPTWVFRCQGHANQTAPHRKDGRGVVHLATLGSAERQVDRSELDVLAAQIRDLEAQEETSSTSERRRRLDALVNRQAALERAFSDGRSSATVRRLTNGIATQAYP